MSDDVYGPHERQTGEMAFADFRTRLGLIVVGVGTNEPWTSGGRHPPGTAFELQLRGGGHDVRIEPDGTSARWLFRGPGAEELADALEWAARMLRARLAANRALDGLEDGSIRLVL